MPTRFVISKVRQRLLSIEGFTKEEVTEELDRTGQRMEQKAKTIVRTWTHKPKFTYAVVIRPEFIAVHLVVFGQYKNIWKWVDRGTKPHKIPKFILPYPLFFQTVYIARTQPIAKATSGGGYKVGPWVSAKEVMHPGIKPRLFTEDIEEGETDRFRRDVHNAFRRGVRKAMTS